MPRPSDHPHMGRPARYHPGAALALGARCANYTAVSMRPESPKGPCPDGSGSRPPAETAVTPPCPAAAGFDRCTFGNYVLKHGALTTAIDQSIHPTRSRAIPSPTYCIPSGPTEVRSWETMRRSVQSGRSPKLMMQVQVSASRMIKKSDNYQRNSKGQAEV